MVRKLAGNLISKYRVKIEIPGLLFIDTPGHEAFVNLRKRGGSIADIVILVVDVLKGLEKQTIESIQILKEKKTPFLIALNKIDRIPGWVAHPEMDVISSLNSQTILVKTNFDSLFYKLIGDLANLGFFAERFDRIKDFRSQLSIVPVSALTGEGIPELMLITIGLCQIFLKNKLQINFNETKGVVLEVKEEPGLGTTVDAIIYDGVLKKGDTIVLGGLQGAIITKVKAILVPKPLNDMRSPEDKFIEVETAQAAMGVKIVAADLDKTVAGSPIYVVNGMMSLDKAQELILNELNSIRIKSDKVGVVVKADALGSLEALVDALRRNGIPVRYADIGNISKRDVLEAAITKKSDPFFGVVLAFNVRPLSNVVEEAKELGVPIFRKEVIYELIEEYTKWLQEQKSKALINEFSALIRPAKLKILEGYVFRRSNPVIVGIEVLEGQIKPGYPLQNAKCEFIGTIMQIQESGKTLESATKGQSVAISIKGDVVVGRHIFEGEVLYTAVPEEHANLLKSKFRSMLTEEELALLEEYRKGCEDKR